MIRKSFLLWTVSFITVLIVLNFGLIVSYFLAPAGQIDDNSAYLTDNNVQEKPYLFPLSADIAEAVQTQIPTFSSRSQISSNYLLELTTLGVSAPIILEPSTDLSKVYSALKGGVVHYASTPLPGSWGTSIILGHSSRPWNYNGNYAYVFSKLEKIDEGQTFRIYKDGQPMTFQVSKKIIFSPDTSDTEMLRDFERASGQSVILMTCWPTGTNSKRIALRAELIS